MNLPSNYFMQWFREKFDRDEIRFNFYFEPEARYLNDFLSKKMDSWNPEAPVIISAQTGAGKNYFILKTLLPKLIEENPNEKDLMLILSNRIALNRQTKKKLAELLVEYTHNDKYIREIEKYYTPEGVDQLYLNFGVVTVCSYHQLYNRCFRKNSNTAPIDIKRFKYIVCDECHFFTSDSSFNEDTNKILTELIAQGKHAIRLYLSATPEVAFEAILTEEFLSKENELYQSIEKIENDIGLKEFMVEHIVHNRKQKKKQEKKIEKLYYKKDGMKHNFSFTVDFYYMMRNYDYVKAHVYKTNEELIELVKNSQNKWVIFSDNDGKKIYNLLNDEERRSEKVTSIYLSRKELESSDELKKAYNYIIDKETIEPKVLVTTSLLDNGVNITNASLKNSADKVLNIAIDSFDREQFIQMLGRVRAEEGVSIQLYIKEYSFTRLKSLLKQDASLMVQVLYSRMQSKIFSDSIDKPSSDEFNSCEIHKLINRMSTTLAIIRNEEQDYCIKFSDTSEETQKGRVYEFYKTGEGKEELWSRSIVDLLESSIERDKRKKYIERDIDYGEDATRHKSKLKDNFLYWLYNEQIPDYYENMLVKKLEKYLNTLSAKERNRYKYIVSNKAEESQRTLSIVDMIDLLQQNFDFASKDVFINLKLINALNDKLHHYKKLAEKTCSGNAIDEQLNWIEKTCLDLPAQSEEQEDEETLEEYILSHHVTQDEIKTHERGNHLDKDFLLAKGLKKDSKEAENIFKRFFQGKKFKDVPNKSWEIDSLTYTLKSFTDNTNNHNTYYCFVKK